MANERDDVVRLHTLSSESEHQDYRFMGPTTVCPCGCDLFHIVGSFNSEREVSFYLLDGACWSCGSLVTLPTPIDTWPGVCDAEKED